MSAKTEKYVGQGENMYAEAKEKKRREDPGSLGPGPT
jgi:hypothetical protein